MSKIIVIQHVPYEPLGTIYELLKHKGVRIKYINFSRHPDKRINLDGYDGLIILGGPMNVDQTEQHPHLKIEVDTIQDAMQRQLPILGICLGAQLIAKANGAEVQAHHCKEIGWYEVSPTQLGKSDSFFRHFDFKEMVFQWHGDTFAMPKNAELLAQGKGCCNQAFKINENIYGLQFHLEVDHAVIERWLTTPVMLQELVEAHGEITAKIIREETQKHLERSLQLSQLVFSEFIELIGHRPKRKLLKSV